MNQYIDRTIGPAISQRLFNGKAILLIGARQVGKSTLLSHITDASNSASLHLDCDDPEVRTLLTSPNLNEIRLLVGNSKLVFIDEAQRIPDIGLTLKMIVDNIPAIQLLVSGSSSFELQQSINEPLTGRKYEFRLYPLSVEELYTARGYLHLKQTLETRLIYGSYPDIINHPAEARELLTELSTSYLYRDILQLEGIRRSQILDKLLIALALQIGSEVSYNELSKTVGADSKTIEKYIDLLEKSFVIFRLNAFSRNLRTELTKSKKIYFYDVGIRNAVLSNFSPLELRKDTGALWENYFISERLKYNQNNRRHIHAYFWRTKTRQEIDYIEESDGMIQAFELKWNPAKAKVNLPQSFADSYSPASFNIVTPDNYIPYLLPADTTGLQQNE